MSTIVLDVKLPGFTTETWQANEGLIIEYAFRITAKGIVILGQGNEKGEDPFNAPTNPDWPVQFCFIPAKFMNQYDSWGNAYTSTPDDGQGTQLEAPGISAAFDAAALILD